MRILLFTLFLTPLLVGCAAKASLDDALQGCVRPSDCDDPKAVCAGGTCQTQCIEDRDCDEGKLCRSGACEVGSVTCRADTECPYAYECSQGFCNQIKGFCDRNEDCRSKYECATGARRCVALGAICTGDRDCLNGDTCRDGLCIEREDTDVSDDSEALDTDPRDADKPDLDASDEKDLDDPVDPDLPDAMPDAPGVYIYRRLDVVDTDAVPFPIEDVRHVAFHPSGDYFVALTTAVLVHDWETGVTTRLEVGLQDAVTFTDIAFDPSGALALIVGATNAGAGVLFRFDHGAWVGTDPNIPVISEYTSARRQDLFEAIKYPWGGGNPVVLARTATNANAILREFDPALGDFSGPTARYLSSAGCTDLAAVDDTSGGPGYLVSCGINGADVLYFANGQWYDNLGNNNIGNSHHAAAHPGGDYALIISDSGNAIYRFQEGALNGYTDAPRFSTRRPWNLKFQQEGQRALIVGGPSAGVATVLEYRHGAYDDITDVSIPNIDQAPFSRTLFLSDAAFRPGCDGGILVGGWNNVQQSVGMLVAFQIEGERPCRE